MNAGLLVLRVASERCDAQNERDGASLRSSVFRRSSDSVAAPSQQHYNLALNWSSSSRPSSRCCWQHLEEGRGGTSRGDASCAQHQLRRSSQQQKQAMAVSRDHEQLTGHWAAPRIICHRDIKLSFIRINLPINELRSLP